MSKNEWSTVPPQPPQLYTVKAYRNRRRTRTWEHVAGYEGQAGCIFFTQTDGTRTVLSIDNYSRVTITPIRQAQSVQ